ncbi:MAG: beta-propeller repeat-containing protein [Sphaerisporangium sp.]|nr:beta-propeller repeat-containing protein [Sphaerisporangium sp.]
MLPRWIRNRTEHRRPELPDRCHRRGWSGVRHVAAAVAIAAGLATPVAVSAPAAADPQVREFAYVANRGSDTVSVINTATNTVTATIAVGSVPDGVAIAPNGRRAYVANFSSKNVSVIDTVTNTLVTNIALPGATDPVGVAVSPDGTRVYVTNFSSNNVSVINATNNTFVTNIGLGGALSPIGVKFTPDGTRAYVANLGSGNVSAITATNDTFVTNIPVPAINNRDLVITPDSGRAYVTNQSGNVFVINTTTNSFDTTIPLTGATFSFGIALTPDGSRAYVANYGSDNVSVINTIGNTFVRNIALHAGSSPLGVAITPDGARGYVTNFSSSNVSLIDTIGDTFTSTIAVGASPFGVAIGRIVNDRTTTTLTSSCASEQQGPITFTATVTSPSTIPTGQVFFTSDGADIGSAPLANGRATLPATLSEGLHAIVARFPGISQLDPSLSPVLIQPVGPNGSCPTPDLVKGDKHEGDKVKCEKHEGDKHEGDNAKGDKVKNFGRDKNRSAVTYRKDRHHTDKDHRRLVTIQKLHTLYGEFHEDGHGRHHRDHHSWSSRHPGQHKAHKIRNRPRS